MANKAARIQISSRPGKNIGMRFPCENNLNLTCEFSGDLVAFVCFLGGALEYVVWRD